MSLYFISDFHLGASDRENERRKYELFQRFVDQIRADVDHLVILGDLYDFWFEYHHLIPKRHLHILIKIKELVDTGVRVSYVCGNHDFWIGDFLESELGIAVFRDRLEIPANRGAILAMHGDGLAKSDWKYRILKRILRNRLNIALYRLPPPAISYGLAHLAARSSRQHASEQPIASFVEEYVAYARDRFAEGYFAFVCGHIHAPELRKIGNNYYANCGDWISHYSYLRFDGHDFQLGYVNVEI